MKLLRAGNKDIDKLLEIEKTAIGKRTYSGYFSKKEIKDWISSENVFLIEEGNDIVGSISYEVKNEKEVYISGLIIQTEFQKKGFAKKAIRILLDGLNKYTQVSLAVHPDNPALKLYESLDFVVMSRIEDYFGDGEPRLLMKKTYPSR